MSAATLQRVAVRMLHDPGFCAAVYRDPATALAGLDLSAAERGWLVAPDPRRWRADPERRHRVLESLLTEFPVSCARAVRAHAQAAAAPGLAPNPAAPPAPAAAAEALLAFFGGPAFHAAIQRRGRLVEAFAADLTARFGPGPDPARGVAAAAAIEGAIARARRAALAPVAADPEAADPEASGLRPAPGVEAALAPEGAVEAWQAERAALQADPRGLALAVLGAASGEAPRPAAPPPAAPRDAAPEPEGVWVEPQPDGPAVSAVSPSLAALFLALHAGAPRAEWAARLRAEGLDAAEADALLAEWRQDGLIIAVEIPSIVT